MNKKQKEYTFDSKCGEKAVQIIHEIETAQSRKLTADEIFTKISEYLTQEPCLTIHIIEALAKIPSTETAQLLILMMEKMDEIYTDCPFYGSRRMQAILKRQGYNINRKRISRLMNIMGLKTIYPKKNLSKMNPNHKKFPYLLKNVNINKVNQVWSTDITYIPIKGGFFYLTVVMDWYSRYVLSWRVSNTMDVNFCVEGFRQITG